MYLEELSEREWILFVGELFLWVHHVVWSGQDRGSMLRNGLSCGGNIFVGVYNRTSSLLALKPDKDLPRQAAAANV